MGLRVAWCAVCMMLLVGTASADPKLRVVGAKDGVLALALDGSLELKRTIRVVADDPNGGENVIIAISSLEQAGGAQASTTPPTIAFKSITTEAPATFELTAKLPRPGKYAAEIDIIVGKKRRTTRLEVDATAIPLGVQVRQPIAILGDVGDDHTIVLEIHETAGREWKLNAPRLTGVSLKKGDRMYQTDSSLANAKPVQVPSGGDERVSLNLVGLDRAGEYQGLLRLAATDGMASAEVPFTATLKEAWLPAVIAIGTGVLLSFLLRMWFGTWKRRAETRRAVAILDERLAALEARASSDPGRALVRTLRAHVVELMQDIALGGEPTDLSSRVTLLGRKFPITDAWLEADRAVAQLPEDHDRDALRAKLDDVSAVLVARTVTEAQLTEAEMTVRMLEIRKKRRTWVRGELDRLRLAVKSAGTAVPPQDFAELEELLARADLLLDRDELDALEGGQGVVATAKRNLVRVLGVQLRTMLDGEAPPGFNSEEWDERTTELREQLKSIEKAPTAEAAVRAFEEIRHKYFLTAADALQNAAGAKIGELEMNPKAPAIAPLQRMVTKLRTAMAASSPDKMAGLAEVYATARKEWATLKNATAYQDTVPSPVGVRLPGVLEWIGGVSPGASRLPNMGGAVAPALKIHRGITSAEWLVDLLLLGIAIVTGLHVLWASDATWGGFDSYVVAFLWGLGIHQVGSGPVFGGVLGLRDTFAGPKAP